MPNNAKTYILDDQWTDKDALDFTPYVETLADIIQTGSTPLTIGVFGTWGSGKTSLMKMVKKQLSSEFTIAWFDAWKYDKEESLWRAFLLCVLNALKERASLQGKPVEEFEKLQSLIYRDMELEKVGGVTIDLAKLGGITAKGLAQLSLSFIPGLSSLTKLVEELQSGVAKNVDEATAAIRRERTKIYIEQIQFLEQFQNKFRELIDEHIKPQRFVVFIDDLDRCLPDKAIGVLEAIKLFLDVENCIFVLGLDQDVIACGIEMKYKELGTKQYSDNQQHFTIEGMRYLEKIIQLPFQIPPVEQADMSDFVHGLSADWPHEDCPKVFAEGLGYNPRQIKRTVNTFLMLWKLAEKRKAKLQERVKPIRLAKVVAIQNIYPDLYNLLLKEEPRYLADLEKYYRAETFEKGSVSVYEKRGIRTIGESISVSKDKQDEEQRVEKFELPPALVPFLSRRGATIVRRILTLHKREIRDANFVDMPPDELKLYFTLTRRAETPQPTPEVAPLGFEPQMVRIPAGQFLMGSTPLQIQEIIAKAADKSDDWNWLKREEPQHQVVLSEYLIGKYPVTNREYQAFIRREMCLPPEDWNGDQYPTGRGDHPVTNVSWKDAQSYCEWLSKITAKVYRLPTEAEWEKAARGDKDARIYPWGNEFSLQNCNVEDINFGDTVPVDWFSPQGDSPYGCAGMVGNVWEWCADWFDENAYKNRGDRTENPVGPSDGVGRIVRGGSYNFSRDYARCSIRGKDDPGFYFGSIGFRVVLSVTISEISI